MLKRIAIAALIASLVPTVPFAAFALFDGPAVAWEWAASAWFVSAAHVVVLGIPVFLFLVRSGRASRMSLVVAGFVLGYLPVFVLMGLRAAGLQMGLVFGVLGALSAWAFWWVLSRGDDAHSFTGG